MVFSRAVALAALVSLLCGPVSAADFANPEWPCLQRKVDSLSLGLMWTGPVPEGEIRPEIRERADQLVETLVLRRVSLEEAESLIDSFVATTPDLSAEDLGQVFRGVFERINADRSRLIKGIARYSLKQIDVAARVDATRVEMDRLMAMPEPDFDKIDALEEQLDWDQRIFRDRAQSLTYVCETPVLLEKRAFAIANALAQHLPD